LGYFCDLKEEQVLIGMDENVAMMVRRCGGGAFHKVEVFVYQSQKCPLFLIINSLFFEEACIIIEMCLPVK